MEVSNIGDGLCETTRWGKARWWCWWSDGNYECEMGTGAIYKYTNERYGGVEVQSLTG